MFLQIHFLTSYHATLLNRDDVGLAKRINFGGSPRLRVSSQCQKRHWREWILDQTSLPRGFRTRYFFSRIVKKRLVEGGMEEKTAHDLILQLSKEILSTAGEKTALDQDTLAMKQPVLFGKPEADYFIKLIKKASEQGDLEKAKSYITEQVKHGKGNFKTLLEQAGYGNPAAGFEGALFGRFVTSDILARVDAPVHVAHAFTTHPLDTEVDFFTVVDDLAGDETGAAHANDMELGGGIFYGYVVVDVPLLVSNLTGCDRADWVSQELVDTCFLLNLLIQAITQVTPGAKLGATAPYARAEWVLLEIGANQPRSLANAFLNPVHIHRNGSHPMGLSIEAIADYISALDKMYGGDGEKRFVSVVPVHNWPRDNEEALPLQTAIDQSLKEIAGKRS